MKKLIYLCLSLLISIGVSAQTVSKPGYGTTTNQGSKSGNSNYNYSGSSRSSGSTSTRSTPTRSTTTSSSRTTTSSSSSNYNHSGYPRSTSKAEPNAPSNTIVIHSLKKTEVNAPKKETVEIPDGTTKEGGITKVGTEKSATLINYEDKAKHVSTENTATTDSQNGSTTVTTDSANVNQSSVTVANSNAKKPCMVYSCSQLLAMNNQEIMDILAQYEMVDLTNLNSCGAFNNRDKFTVTCEEFKEMPEVRRKHILTHKEFYNLANLINCEKFFEYRENSGSDSSPDN